jgi:hypothetical protein
VEVLGGGCGDNLAGQVLNVGPDGAIQIGADPSCASQMQFQCISKLSCASQVRWGCESQLQNCTATLGDPCVSCPVPALPCTVNANITFATDGSTASGVEYFNCRLNSGVSDSCSYYIKATRQ